MNKKAQISQVFVYLLSIIIIAFVGFLVGKFILTFSSDVETRADSKLYETLETDFQTVYQTYSSEKVLDYKVSSEVRNICFIENPTCLNSTSFSSSTIEELKIVHQAGDNVITLDEDGILSSQNIGSFKVNGGCFCLEPKNTRFTLLFENIKNQVYIQEE